MLDIQDLENNTDLPQLEKSLVFDTGLDSSFGSIAESIADNHASSRRRDTKTWEGSLEGFTEDSNATFETEKLSQEGSLAEVQEGSGRVSEMEVEDFGSISAPSLNTSLTVDWCASSSSLNCERSRKTSRRQRNKTSKYKTLLRTPTNAKRDATSNHLPMKDIIDAIEAVETNIANHQEHNSGSRGSRRTKPVRLPRRIKSEGDRKDTEAGDKKLKNTKHSTKGCRSRRSTQKTQSSLTMKHEDESNESQISTTNTPSPVPLSRDRGSRRTTTSKSRLPRKSKSESDTQQESSSSHLTASMSKGSVFKSCDRKGARSHKKRLPPKIKSEENRKNNSTKRSSLPPRSKTFTARAAMSLLIDSGDAVEDDVFAKAAASFSQKVARDHSAKKPKCTDGNDSRAILTKAVADIGLHAEKTLSQRKLVDLDEASHKLCTIRKSVTDFAALSKRNNTFKSVQLCQSPPHFSKSLSSLKFEETITLLDRWKNIRNDENNTSSARFHKSSNDVPSFFDWEEYATR